MVGHRHHTPQIPNMFHIFWLGVVGRVYGADPNLALPFCGARLHISLPSGPGPSAIQTGRCVVINQLGGVPLLSLVDADVYPNDGATAPAPSVAFNQFQDLNHS